jgi:hypothetical protein
MELLVLAYLSHLYATTLATKRDSNSMHQVENCSS